MARAKHRSKFRTGVCLALQQTGAAAERIQARPGARTRRQRIRASRGRRGRRAEAQRCRKGCPRRPWEAAQSQAMGAICGKVETQGESRKEVEEDLRIDNRKRNSLIFAVIEWVSAVDANNTVKDAEKLATIIVRDAASVSVTTIRASTHAGAAAARHGDRHGRPQSVQTDQGVRSH